MHTVPCSLLSGNGRCICQRIASLMLIISCKVLLLIAYQHILLLSGRNQPFQRLLLDLSELMLRASLILQDKRTAFNIRVLLLLLNCGGRLISLYSDFDGVPQVSGRHKKLFLSLVNAQLVAASEVNYVFHLRTGSMREMFLSHFVYIDNRGKALSLSGQIVNFACTLLVNRAHLPALAESFPSTIFSFLLNEVLVH